MGFFQTVSRVADSVFRQRFVGAGVDLHEFAWVDLWLLDRDCQAQIKALEAQIQEIRKAPKSKLEVSEEVARCREAVFPLRVKQLSQVLAEYQSGAADVLNPWRLAQVTVYPGEAYIARAHLAAHDFASLLAPDVVAAALAELPEGIHLRVKEAEIASLQAKIDGLRAKSEKECWPESRRVFDDTGRAMPGKDRWAEVVASWRDAARRYNAPCDPDGFELEPGAAAWEAFHKLGLQARLTGATAPRRWAGS